VALPQHHHLEAVALVVDLAVDLDQVGDLEVDLVKPVVAVAVATLKMEEQ
jgi:hypothetical protein